MSRYLFVAPPLAGHVNPPAGVAAELRRRGHQVAWVAHEAVVGPLLGDAARIYPAGDGFLTEIAEHAAERERVKGPAAVLFLWDRFLVPLARHMIGPTEDAVDDFRPDVVVADQQAFAGGLVAAERKIPWAVSASTTADLGEPAAALPRIAEWMRGRIDGWLRESGRDDLATAGFDPRYSPHGVLAYSTPELAGAGQLDGVPVRWVGPILPDRPELHPPVQLGQGDPEPEPDGRDDDQVGFPWSRLRDRPANILVSMGTVSGEIGHRFLRHVVEAVADQPYGVVLVGSADLLPPLPDNVIARPRVPQLDLLPRVQAVLCHAGHNTVTEALAFGAPLVCAPIRDDQPVIAAQVLRSGAGLRVSFSRSRPDDIAAAVDAVLTDPQYRAAAGRLATSFRTAGGAVAAASHLEALATSA